MPPYWSCREGYSRRCTIGACIVGLYPVYCGEDLSDTNEHAYIKNWSDTDLLDEIRMFQRQWQYYEEHDVRQWAGYYSAMEKEANERGLTI